MNLDLGGYQIDFERGENGSVSIYKGDRQLYTGQWYDTLEPFFARIRLLSSEEQEREMQLAFDLPSFSF